MQILTYHGSCNDLHMCPSQAPEDPFSSMADRPSYVSGYGGAAYGGSASGYGGSGSGYGSGPVSPSTARSGAGSSTGNPFFDGAPLALPPAQPASAAVVSPTASPLARGALRLHTVDQIVDKIAGLSVKVWQINSALFQPSD